MARACWQRCSGYVSRSSQLVCDEPTQENTWRRTYALTRYSTAFVNRLPGQPLDPKVKEFLRYVLSQDGMAAVVRDKAFQPLNADAIRGELKTLE